MRQLLRSGGLAQPDLVEYDPGSIVLRWTGPKLAVVVDLDGPPDHGGGTAMSPGRPADG